MWVVVISVALRFFVSASDIHPTYSYWISIPFSRHQYPCIYYHCFRSVVHASSLFDAQEHFCICRNHLCIAAHSNNLIIYLFKMSAGAQFKHDQHQFLQSQVMVSSMRTYTLYVQAEVASYH